jgi:hypothetical protein
MRIKLFAFITLVASIPDFVQNEIQAQEYNQGMALYDDPISGGTILVQQFVASSKERLISGYRFAMRMQFIKSVRDQTEDYAFRAVLWGNPMEWPIKNDGYLMVDDAKFPISLTHLSAWNTQSISNKAVGGADEMYFDDTQFRRVESPLSNELLNKIEPTSQVQLVFYSGIFPLTFKLSRFETTELIRMRNFKVR